MTLAETEGKASARLSESSGHLIREHVASREIRIVILGNVSVARLETYDGE
jgi:hypothetical protein